MDTMWDDTELLISQVQSWYMVIQDNVPGLGKHMLRYLQVKCHEICNLLLDGLAKENVVG